MPKLEARNSKIEGAGQGLVRDFTDDAGYLTREERAQMDARAQRAIQVLNGFIRAKQALQQTRPEQRS